VATRVGGTPEIIEDGVSGLLVPPRDSNSLAAGIRRILLDAKFGHELGRAAQHRVRSEFSFDRLVTELGELYAEGLQHRREVVPRPEQDNMARRILS
jgi:glycosyltransferase involved in cell wall biosynthesis